MVIYPLQLHENDTSIDNFKASEEIHLVQEDKVEEAQTTASPVEQPDSTTGGTEMESALLEKTNDDIDVNANVDESSVTSFAKEEGAVINQTDNGSETLPVVEQTHAEVHIKAKIFKIKGEKLFSHFFH